MKLSSGFHGYAIRRESGVLEEMDDDDVARRIARMKMLILGFWLALALPCPALPPSRELVAFARACVADHKELRTLEKFSTGPDRRTAERLVAISDHLWDSTSYALDLMGIYALVTNDENKAEILVRVEDCLLSKAGQVALWVTEAEVEK